MSEYPDLSSLRDLRIDTSFTARRAAGGIFLQNPCPGTVTPARVGKAKHRPDETLLGYLLHNPKFRRRIRTLRKHHGKCSLLDSNKVRGPTLLRKSEIISESELDDEYMTVTIGENNECNYKGHGYGFSEVAPMAANGKSEKRNFVGGFVSGLRRLPKVISKGRLRDHSKPERQGTGAMVSAFETGRSTLPRYSGPLSSGIPKTNSDDIPTVERLETPTRASSVSPPARHANPADGEVSLGDGRRERVMLSAVHEHEHSLNSLLAPRQHSRSHNTSGSSRPFEREEEVPNAISPILAEPRPSADFAKMESPIRPPPAESVASQLARVRRFFRDLNGLPWIASRDISDVYRPGQSALRRRYSRPRESKSWYTPRNSRTLDLFAGPSTTGLLAPTQPTPVHAQPGGAAPFILGSSANLLISQPPHGGNAGGGSRSPSHEGPPSTDSQSHGSQAPVLAPAYVAQPLFVYPSGLPQPGAPRKALDLSICLQVRRRISCHRMTVEEDRGCLYRSHLACGHLRLGRTKKRNVNGQLREISAATEVRAPFKIWTVCLRIQPSSPGPV
ncbi:hypothetical protein BU15DRAFT_67394 [Melanogaster broomeanus]|nr:hypothetical protein BU15DRAFT_67394 [Melanogaster broomeanus]